MRSSSAESSGFTLIEVLIALAIVGLALGTAATVFRDGLLSHAAAADLETAIALADEKLAAAGSDTPLEQGETRGVFARRFGWRLAIKPYEDRPDHAIAAFRLYRLEAEVTWLDGWRKRRIALDTLRLAPAP